jgi:hypothetical protein
MVEHIKGRKIKTWQCEGWESGLQVRFANSKFLSNFKIKTDLKLFVTHHKYKFA